MVDLLGPADAGASPTLTTTTDVTSPVAGDTFFEDCPSGVAGGGTPIDSKWLNRIMQQMRVAIRASNVPLSNSYDDMLSWAMQSGYVNWVGEFGGTANALSGYAPNNLQAIQGGTYVCGIIVTSPNTGAVTFNWASLGAQPVTLASGAALVGGELQTNWFLVMFWDGGAWRIISPTYVAPATPPTPFDPFATTGVGAIIVASSISSADSTPLEGVVGAVSTWAYFSGSGAGAYRITGGSEWAAADIRWPSSVPDGSWELISVSLNNSLAYGSSGVAATSVWRKIS